MANVGHTEYQRGQIMIVMSLVIAVMLVAMALYLNTAIFTENLATRKGDIAGAGGAISYQYAITEGAAGVLTYANYNNDTSYNDLEDALETDLANWSQATNQLESTRSRSVDVSVADTSEGTRIIQDTDREFTNESEAPDWHVVNGTTGVRKFQMDVTRADLGDSWPGNAPHEDDLFTITFDGTTVREVQVYGNVSEDNLHVTVLDENGDTMGSCTISDEARAVVNVTGAQLGGEPCEPLRFFSDLGPQYDIAFTHSTNAYGTYELIVEQDTNTFGLDVGDNYHIGDTSPYYREALYSAEINVTYQTARIDYRTVVRIAPGEPE